jgi:hypothetical protein
VRHGDIEPEKLFSIVDITEDVLSLQDEVAEQIRFLETYMANTTEPDRELSIDCFSPYKCGYWKYCTRELPSPNVFDIGGRMLKKKKFELYRKGIVSFRQAYSEGGLTSSAKIQVEAELENKIIVNKGEIRDFLSFLSYPIYFLDFETVNFAIPQYDDTSPYMQIPFQYSLHYIEREGGELCHKEFLAQHGKDPRRELAERLCRDIPRDVCVTAYNMSFEKGRIKGLAELYPDLREHLMNIHDNIQDLMIPFREKQYYTKAMQGSYSIKYVLPALFPDDPSLDYHNLEGVHNGSEASAAFAAMEKMTPEELAACRANLLKYCGLDTFAMVKVFEKLQEVVD